MSESKRIENEIRYVRGLVSESDRSAAPRLEARRVGVASIKANRIA